MTAQAISYRIIGSGDFPDVRALYTRVWQRSRSETYDRMRFVETMAGLPVAALAHAGDELIGLFTLWPLLLTDGEVVVKGAEGMDVMTDDRFRGRGIFPKLADEAIRTAAAQGIKLLFGAPNKAIFGTYVRRLAWAAPGWIRSFVRPLSLRGVLPLGSLASPLFALWPRRKIGPFTIRTGRPGDDALDACLAADGSGRGAWRLHRTRAWYDFRFRDAGRFDYRWICVWRGDELVAFAIVGIAMATDARLRRANLADVVGDDRAARQTAVGAAVREATSAGANALVVLLTSRRRAAEFGANGFLPFRRSPLIAKTLGPDAFAANPFTPDGWDLIGADFDFV